MSENYMTNMSIGQKNELQPSQKPGEPTFETRRTISSIRAPFDTNSLRDMAEDLQPSASFTLNYSASKDQVCELVSQTYHEVMETDPEFVKKTRRAAPLDVLIYDLGHGVGTGRSGLGNFRELALIMPPPVDIVTQSGKKGKQVEMPMADLLRQIAIAADTFIAFSTDLRKDSPHKYEEEIKGLLALADKVGERKVRFTMVDVYEEGKYQIQEPIQESGAADGERIERLQTIYQQLDLEKRKLIEKGQGSDMELMLKAASVADRQRWLGNILLRLQTKGTNEGHEIMRRDE